MMEVVVFVVVVVIVVCDYTSLLRLRRYVAGGNIHKVHRMYSIRNYGLIA